jgi:transcriptional regulator with XRE-family HTH domain
MNLNLKIAFLRSGKKQREVSIAERIPETRLSDIVCGRTRPRPDERVALARALDVPADVLFEEAGELLTTT